MQPTGFPALPQLETGPGWPPGLHHWPGFLDGPAAQLLHDELLVSIPWETHSFTIFGRTVPMPRRIQMFGPHGYRYSGVVHPARPLGDLLTGLCARLEAATGLRFNSVLANHYRDGRDSMGWHSDDDYAHGGQPWIASLSLGQRRRFRLRSRADPGRSLGLELASGSLLLMGPGLQVGWQHALPRSARPMSSRINLTWRHMVAP